MLDKERLKEIEAKHSILTVTSERNDIEYIEVDVKDLVFLIRNSFKQAERVEELEKVIGDLDENVAAFETLWLEEKRKNKRYRKAIERALDESGWGDEGNALNKIISILAKALEGDDD